MNFLSRNNRAGFAALLLIVLGLAASGCTSVKDYSVQSYQGPLPAADLRHVSD
jgi:hypothetical protein